jgi:hypothetical protein
VVAFLLATACTAVLGVKDITGATGPGDDDGSSGGGSSSGTGSGSSTSSSTGGGGRGSSGAGSGSSSSSGGASNGTDASSSASDSGAAAWVGTWMLSGMWIISDCTNSSADESLPAPTVTWMVGGSGLTGVSSNGCQFDATAASGFLSLTSSSPPCTLTSGGRTDQIAFGKWIWFTDQGDAGISTTEYPDGTDTVTLPGGSTTTCKISISGNATRE